MSALRAFVLSGGGNRGPLQVGAMKALLEHGIEPDFLVGTSAGAINAVGFALNPTLDGVEHLAEAWKQVRGDRIYPGGLLCILWRMLTGRLSLFPGEGLRREIEKRIPSGVQTFGDLPMPAFVTAADLKSGSLIVFGDRAEDPLLEGVLASASVPGIHPPVEWEGRLLVDGGVLAVTPVEIALYRGATEMYVLDLTFFPGPFPPARNIVDIALFSFRAMLFEQIADDLIEAIRAGATVHHVCFDAMRDIDFRDFRHAGEMIEVGYQTMRCYLENPKPNRLCEAAVSATWRMRIMRAH